MEMTSNGYRVAGIISHFKFALSYLCQISGAVNFVTSYLAGWKITNMSADNVTTVSCVKSSKLVSQIVIFYRNIVIKMEFTECSAVVEPTLVRW